MAFKQESKLNQSLIKEVRSGKSSAYEQLYNVHAGRIYNLGLRFYAHSRIAAEELTRKVFIRAYEEINAYPPDVTFIDRKSTRLNSSHVRISYAVFCLKKKKKK